MRPRCWTRWTAASYSARPGRKRPRAAHAGQSLADARTRPHYASYRQLDYRGRYKMIRDALAQVMQVLRGERPPHLLNPECGPGCRSGGRQARYEAENLLFILSDQHNVNVMGCSGNEAARTPNLDALAARGTRFANAYTNCPICVPARASLATGQYVHQIGNWDNAFPWDGSPRGWGHQLKDKAFTSLRSANCIFVAQRTTTASARKSIPCTWLKAGVICSPAVVTIRPRATIGTVSRVAGPGDSTYLRYDASNTAHAPGLAEQARAGRTPWVLFLSLVCPHPPFIAPPEYFAGRKRLRCPCRRYGRKRNGRSIRCCRGCVASFTMKALQRGDPAAAAGDLYAVCEYVDDNIGHVVRALGELGLNDRTRVIYSSDHGESLGRVAFTASSPCTRNPLQCRSLWLALKCPPVRWCRHRSRCLTWRRRYLKGVGAAPNSWSAQLPGGSLWTLMQQENHERSVFSEYHAVGTPHAYYMLRDLRYKYVHYVNAPPQLFDMQNDPWSCMTSRNCRSIGQCWLSGSASCGHCWILRQLTRKRADQRTRIEAFGGEAAVRARGTFTNSPVPGEAPGFRNEAARQSSLTGVAGRSPRNTCATFQSRSGAPRAGSLVYSRPYVAPAQHCPW